MAPGSYAPAWILDIIEHGFLLPFKDWILPPKYHNDRNNFADPGASDWAAEERSHMERLGAVERVETPPHMVMPLREARKSSWTAEKPVWRLCHNQHRLNRNITKFKLKPDSLREFAKSVQRYDFLFAIDLTSAYTHILILPKHRRFMGFRFPLPILRHVRAPVWPVVCPVAIHLFRLRQFVSSFAERYGCRCHCWPTSMISSRRYALTTSAPCLKYWESYGASDSW